MKYKMLFCTGLACMLAFSSFVSSVPALELSAVDYGNLSDSDNDLRETTVYVLGDSTACIYAEDETYAVPRGGWAMYLQNYLDSKAQVVDLALGGRSSKSFIKEPEYETFTSNLKAGDYVIIQFGHNDAKSSNEEDLANRYTDPLGDIESDSSFRYHLYNNYIKFALDKGAYPILISPVSRRKFDDNGKIQDTHKDYDDTVRALAQETNTPFIDMTAITEEYYNNLGVEDTKLMHALYNDRTKSEGIDNTHYSHYGANVIARTVAENLLKLDTGLKNYVVESKFSATDNNYITKGEFTALITRALSLESEGADELFDDVPENADNVKYIAYAKALGVVAGGLDGNMGFSEYITRQDAAAIAYRAISKVKDIKEENTSAIENCPDYDLVLPYAADALSYMIRSGYLSTKDGNIAPLDRLTKEEAERITVALYYLQAEDIIAENANNEISLDELEKVETTK